MATTVTPQGTVSLCKTPLENDYKHQLTFNNATAQHNYFASTVQYTQNDCTYIKADNVLYFDKNIDQIRTCNYLFYKNTGFTNKWFYCFITRMEYENENCTAIYFETDVYQTWLFNLTYKRCFVEREHVNDDTIGAHTVPEGLETGEYKCNAEYQTDNSSDWSLQIVLGSTYDLDAGSTYAVGNMYTGVYSAIPYYHWPISQDVQLTTALEQLSQETAQSSIQCMFLAPDFVVEQYSSGTVHTVKRGVAAKRTDIKVPVVNTIDGYTPKNNKLLTYPYVYLDGSNGQGSNAIYHTEKFYNTDYDGYYTFACYGVLVPGCSIRMIPKFYNGLEVNNDEGITLGKYPQLNWITDQYTNWLTQNGVNIGLTTARGVVKTAVGVGAMAVAPEFALYGGALAVSGIDDVYETAKESYEHSLVPPQAEGNLNSGDVSTTIGYNRFRIKRMTIKQEFAKIIDNYFSMYGYKVNTVKIPNMTGRTNWNYVKTIDCNFEGDIPQEDLNRIKAMFNNGVTLWHNASTMLDYSQSNN